MGADGAWAEVRPAAGADGWPLGGLVDDIRPALERELARGRACVLATLVKTEGSAPRPPGAQMLVCGDGSHLGYVAGGCVEAVVAAEALRLMGGPPRRLLALGRGSPFVDVALACGGRLQIAMERIDPGDDAAAAMLAAWRERKPVLWLSGLDGAARFCAPDAAGPGPLQAARAEALRDGRPDGGGLAPDGLSFWRRHTPGLRLILMGSDPVTLAIARLAQACGHAVALIRPRGPAAGPAGLELAYERGGVEAALARWPIDAWTAVVAATHDLELDNRLLARALAADAFYVGVLGSRARIGERRAQLAALGLDEDRIGRLRAPLGLPIGAATPCEIALAALAQVTAAWRGAAA